MKKKSVLITGCKGALGTLFTKHLAKTNNFFIHTLDPRPFNIKLDCHIHHQTDLTRKSTFDLLRQIHPQIIVHLGIIRNPQKHRRKRENIYYYNLESTSRLLSLTENIHIEKMIFLSSANLYGPSMHTSGFLTENFPLHGADKHPEFRDLVSLDMMMQTFFFKQPKTDTIILRPCHIVGKHLNNAPSNYFRLSKIPTILGFDPMIQLIHESDLVKTMHLAIEKKARGIYNLAGKGQAPLSKIIESLQRPSIPLPDKLLRFFTAGAFLGRGSLFLASELDHLKYSCLVDDSFAKKELQHHPKKNLKSILREMQKDFEKLEQNNLI